MNYWRDSKDGYNVVIGTIDYLAAREILVERRNGRIVTNEYFQYTYPCRSTDGSGSYIVCGLSPAEMRSKYGTGTRDFLGRLERQDVALFPDLGAYWLALDEKYDGPWFAGFAVSIALRLALCGLSSFFIAFPIRYIYTLRRKRQKREKR